MLMKYLEDEIFYGNYLLQIIQLTYYICDLIQWLRKCMRFPYCFRCKESRKVDRISIDDNTNTICLL